MSRRRLASLLVALLLAFTAAPASGAEIDYYPATDEFIYRDGVSGPIRQARRNPLAACEIRSGLTGTEVLLFLEIVDPPGNGDDWVGILCPPDDAASRDFLGVSRIGYREGDPVPGTTPTELVAEALGQIPFDFNRARSAPEDPTPFLTQLPVWFWVDPVDWDTKTGVATLNALPGNPSVSVTATPQSTEFRINGVTQPCAGPGVEFQRGLDDSATDCTITLEEPTQLGETVTLEVIVVYELSVVCTWGCRPSDVINVPATRRINTPSEVTIAEARGLLGAGA